MAYKIKNSKRKLTEDEYELYQQGYSDHKFGIPKLKKDEKVFRKK